MKTKVLIVEDQADIRTLIKMTLEFGDYEIIEADNGDDGFAMANAAWPDVMLLDVMMPGSMDGSANAFVQPRRWPTPALSC